jgi:hypothetical protein
MRRSGLGEWAVGLLVFVVAGSIAVRWAYEQLRPVFPVLIVAAVLVGLWRVSSLVRSRW